MDTNIPLQKITQKDGISLAYRLRLPQNNAPMIVFLGGYRSDMEGSKATALDLFCAQHGYGLLRFDYSGHGASGGVFRNGCIGTWLNDAQTVINTLVASPFYLIGSSMGGWIGLLLARSQLNQIKGFIGIAAAPDFTSWVWHQHMTDAERSFCQTHGYIESPEGDLMTLKLFEDGDNHLVLNQPLTLGIPITFIHGKQDRDVPWVLTQQLSQHITPSRVETIFIEDGDHRLARTQDLDILFAALQKMVRPSAT